MLGTYSARLSTWLRQLFPARRPAARTRSYRFLVETLEDRTLLNGTTLLVQMKPGFASSAFDAPTTSSLLADAQFQATRIDGLFQVHIDDSKLTEVTNLLRSNSAVAYAEPQVTFSVGVTPNDPRFTDGTLFGLNGAFGINAPTAWDNTTGTTTPIVAVIDTGVDYSHVDLYRNIWINQAEIPASVRAAIQSDPTWDIDSDGLITFWDLNDPRNQGVGKITDRDADGRITAADILRTTALGGWSDNTDADGNGYRDDLVGWNFINNTNNPLDDNNHGTHVSGTIGATGNDATGVVGINWKVQIMPLKFLDAGGSGNDSAAAAAIRYAADRGSQVSNNSWGGGGFSSTLNNAIAYAATRDHLFVAAAGNSSADTDVTANYPSNYNQPNIISVAATTSTGALASFSNYGFTTVDLGAPGQNIYSTIRGGGYAFFSGTSMATPHVAGAAALLLAQNPSMTYADLKDRLLATTTPLASLAGRTVTGGLLNLGAAIQTGPEISVLDGATNLVDGASTVNFGPTFAGVPVSKTFTVRNAGTETLTLTNPINVPAGYTVTSGFGALSLSPGASTTFTVQLTAPTNGTYTGQISFANNDSNENPFNFNVTGTVSNVAIIDNGDAGFSTVGSWSYASGGSYSQYFQSDTHYRLGGASAEVSSWTFNVAPGTYRISATWVADPNRATNAQYRIRDGATILNTVTINQELAPNSFNEAGAAWKDLGASSYSISSSTLVVELLGSGNEWLIADAVRVEKVADPVAAPEIKVLDGATDIADNTGSVAFGTTAPGVPVSKTFTVQNLGTQNLTLGTISLPAGYTLTSDFGVTTLAPGASTTFVVQMTAASVGSYSGTLSFGNNDADENPFNFSINGTVAVLPVVTIIDNGDAGFSTVGSWSYASGGGYTEYFQSDTHYRLGSAGTDMAIWSFNVAPGTYRVSATWTANPNRATNAQYRVLDGSTVLNTVNVNQELAPSSFRDAGAAWMDLGASSYTITGTTLVVQMLGTGNEWLIADAIRIEKI